MGRSGGFGGRSGGGRSGGSFGGSRSGGGRSSGSFGGTRSGGGRSSGSFGGTRSGGGRSSGSFGSSGGGMFGNNRKSGPIFTPVFRPRIPIGGGFSRPPRSTRGNGCGCLTLIIIIIVVLVLVSVFSSIYSGSSGSNDRENISPSTLERVPLPAGSVNETDYYTDQIGLIKNESKLISGLRYFYKETGVQPYLYLTDIINGSHYPENSEIESFAYDLYEELFTDEGHLLLVYHEYGDIYTYYYVAGAQAKSVVDREGIDILFDYIDRYYYDNSLSYEEFFSKSFRDAADRMMKITRSPWIRVFLVFGILIIVIILFRWWQKHREEKKLEAKRREEILKTPLDKFGDREAEELLRKYQNDDEHQ